MMSDSETNRLGRNLMNLTKEQANLLLPEEPMTEEEFSDSLKTSNEGKEYRDVMFYDPVQAKENKAFLKTIMKKNN